MDTAATLPDFGNFVLIKGDAVIWKSFDYPADTCLPGMKVRLWSMWGIACFVSYHSNKGTYASTWFVMASTGQPAEHNMVDVDGGKRKKSRLIVTGAMASLPVLILVLLSYLQWTRHKKKGNKVRNGEQTSESLETTFLRIGIGAPAEDLQEQRRRK
ncbi:hypothetical protein NL676_034037 [Syzygium grande]|nr:hypothetical protein NL676_034037 [Syzygium grande]